MSTKNKTYLLSILILVLILITSLVVSKNTFVISLDSYINNFFVSNKSSVIYKIMLSITKICSPYEAFSIFIVFGIFLTIKHVKHSQIFALTTFLGTFLPIIIKNVVSRIRPSTLLEQDYSFPSAHATLAVVFLLSSLILIAPHIKRIFSKNLFLMITLTIFPLVAFSRIYIGVHWTSDVIAGIILGAICFVTSDLLSCYKKENVL